MNTKAKTIIGIDYSLTSPAVCITDDCKFNNSHFYYLTNRKKYVGKMMKNIEGFEHEEYTDNIKRFKNISNFVFHVLGRHISPKIGFRPESVSLGNGQYEGKIISFENLGSETVVAIDYQGNEILASVQGNYKSTINEIINFDIDANKVLKFDKEGNRIYER